MDFVDCLSKQSKENWPVVYEHFTGKKWRPLRKDKRGIRLEAKLEDVEEIGRIMCQVPNSTERK